MKTTNLLLILALSTAVLLLGIVYVLRSGQERMSDDQLDKFYQQDAIEQLAIFKQEKVVVVILKDGKRPMFFSPKRYYINFQDWETFVEHMITHSQSDHYKKYDFINHDQYEYQRSSIPSLSVFEYR